MLIGLFGASQGFKLFQTDCTLRRSSVGGINENKIVCSYEVQIAEEQKLNTRYLCFAIFQTSETFCICTKIPSVASSRQRTYRAKFFKRIECPFRRINLKIIEKTCLFV